MASLRYETDRERSYRTEWTLGHKQPVPRYENKDKGEQVNVVYRTDDLSRFNRLACNRRVNPHRLAQLKASITEHGFIGGPIVVNEKYEVIDGQGRLLACQEVKSPIEYIIRPGLGIDDCITLNQNGTTWKLDDYILSYAERGIEDYIRLFDLMPAVGDKRLRGTTTVLRLCGCCGAKGYETKKVQDGLFKMNTEVAAKVGWVYQFLEAHADDIFSAKGRPEMFARAIAFALVWTKATPQRMGQVLKERIYLVQAVGTIKDAIEEVDKLYNWHLRENAVDIVGAWKEYVRNSKRMR